LPLLSFGHKATLDEITKYFKAKAEARTDEQEGTSESWTIQAAETAQRAGRNWITWQFAAPI
jgi:hypothetical protein